MREASLHLPPSGDTAGSQAGTWNPMILLRVLFSGLSFHLPGRHWVCDVPLIPFLLGTMGSWPVPGKRLIALHPKPAAQVEG